jgi:RNA polymerase sigma-70 factor (ECF subfamily)
MARPKQAPPLRLTHEWLYERFAPKVRRHVRRVMGADNEHDDLVHDVMITVFRKVGSLRDPACIDAWVRQVTVNTLRYSMRQRRFRRHLSVDDLAEQNLPSFQSDFESRQLASRVLHFVDRLSPNEREVLNNFWFGCQTDLATAKGCSVATVRRRLRRVRTRFEKFASRDPALLPRVAAALHRVA